ncbi:MAG: archaellin/type IV pilin N-terminal domain-containing protein, partial [Sulfolobales archaeon]
HVGKHTSKVRKGIVGIEAAIILIAFVIISAAFAFMVINMGLFATQRSKDTISQGLREASSPLQVDGNIFIRVNSSLTVNATVIPLRAMGVKYVPVGKNETVVSLSIIKREGSSIAYSNIYYGVNTTFNPRGSSFDELVQVANVTLNNTLGGKTPLPAAILLVENNNGDEALDSSEKGFLVVMLGNNYTADPRSLVTIEIRVERSAPLTVEFMVPEALIADSWMLVTG